MTLFNAFLTRGFRFSTHRTGNNDNKEEFNIPKPNRAMNRIMLNHTTTPAIQRISTIQMNDTIMAMTKALKYKNSVHAVSLLK